MADFDARMAALRARFIAQVAQEAALITSHARGGAWGEVRSLCHGLAGRAGMFGFAPLGDAAREVEEAIDAEASEPALRPLVERLLAETARLPAA